jgi:hypothetical protein
MDVPIWKASFTVGQTFPSNVANGADPEIRDYLTRDPAFTSFQGVSTLTLTSDPGAGTAQVDIRGMFATTQQAARMMAQRYLALYGGRRDFWTFSVPMADDVLALELHDVVTLKSPRFGLAAGRKHRIVGITIDCAAPVPQMRFVLWGGQAGLWTASTGGPGTPGYVRPGGGTDPGITAAARNSIGDFTGYMAGAVVAAPSSMFGPIGDFTGYIRGTVTNDEYFEYVVSCVLFNDANGSTTAVARVGPTVTRYGAAVVSSDQQHFDGNTYKNTAANAASSFRSASTIAIGSAADFTIECWAYKSGGTGGYRHIVQYGSSLTNRTNIGVYNGKLTAYLESGAGNILTFSAADDFPSDQWVKTSASKIGNSLYLFQDQVLVGTGDATGKGMSSSSSGAVCIGTQQYSPGPILTDEWIGYIDDVRVTEGVGRYSPTKLPDLNPLLFE